MSNTLDGRGYAAPPSPQDTEAQRQPFHYLSTKKHCERYEDGTKVLKYFADLCAKGGVPLDPISVLLVGRGGSGKSTLVHRAVSKQQALPNGILNLFCCS
jgi:hypothetical protein